jgi:alpha-amylase
MCTKWFADGDVHAYFSPYESPYEAFMNYMNIVQDLSLRVKAEPQSEFDQNYQAVAKEATIY